MDLAYGGGLCFACTQLSELLLCVAINWFCRAIVMCIRSRAYNFGFKLADR